MGKENLSTKMEGIMMDNGKIIKCVGKEHCTTIMEKWFMMGIGRLINIMGWELNIIKRLFR